MSKRKEMPDKLNKPFNVLDALQGVETKKLEPEKISEDSSEEIESSAAESGKPKNTEERKVSNISGPKKDAPAATAKKLKVNLYLSGDTKDRTEEMQRSIRKIAGRVVAGKINQSLIVETALEIVFDEFDRVREGSNLVKEILRKLQN